MALIELRRIENVSGEFFVDNTCIDCDLCRQIAPTTFSQAGDQSAVFRQPETPEEKLEALKALVSCPTASIGTATRHSAKSAVEAYPEKIENEVYFCGFASKSSYGASSYLILRREGNVMIDSPRFARPLITRITALGGVKKIFLTHRDDIADSKDWAEHFNAERIMHEDDITRTTKDVEQKIKGNKAVMLDDDMIAIPTPGHTRGHMVLLYKNRYLFSGDHLWHSPNFGALNASRSVCWHSWSEQTKSMERLLEYNFEWVLPGHGRRAHESASAMRSQLESCIKRMKK